jgi:hypothetical protein
MKETKFFLNISTLAVRAVLKKADSFNSEKP